VPAVAVIHVGQALFSFIGCKASVDDFSCCFINNTAQLYNQNKTVFFEFILRK
jgi:hypothetical protein